MAGLRTTTAVFLVLLLLPAGILAWLGWQATVPLVEELRRAAREDAGRAAAKAADALPAELEAQAAARTARLLRLAGELRASLPGDEPGRAFRSAEQAAGTAVRVVRRDGTALLPAGAAPCDPHHLPEWPRFDALQGALARGESVADRAAAAAFAAPQLRARAVALLGSDDPAAAAAQLERLPWPALAAAGPAVPQVLSVSPNGRRLLAQGLAAGWLHCCPATEAGRTAWLAAAGAGGAELLRQQLRARQERGGGGPGAPVARRVPLAPGVDLEELVDPAALLPAPREAGGVRLRFAPAPPRGSAPPPAPAAVLAATDTVLGRVTVTAEPLGLPAIEAAARRRQWLTGLGIALLFGTIVVGLALVRRALAQQRRAARLREEFVANVSHELKTPLASLRMYAEMLGDEKLPAGTRADYAAVAAAEGARLSALVDDLLDVAALERGRRRLEPEPVDLGAALRSLAAGARPLAAREGVELRCEERCGNGPATALADPTALVRIVTNLVQNALRHGSPARDGGPRRVVLCAGPGPRVEVRDNGPGVPPAERARIFERFERAVPGARGLGLGLALARALAEAMGGRLECGDDGETVFALQLPPVPALPAPGGLGAACPAEGAR